MLHPSKKSDQQQKYSIKETNNKLEFSISDNGKAFNAAMVRRGNGLENMQKHADEKLVLNLLFNQNRIKARRFLCKSKSTNGIVKKIYFEKH